MKTPYFLGALLSIATACSQSAEEKAALQRMQADEEFNQAINDSVVTGEGNLFITEAGIEGRTSNAATATQWLESFVRSRNGYVENSNLTTEELSSRDVRFTRDSIVTVKQLKTRSEIILRIPFYDLDTTLALALKLMDQVDARNISNEKANLSLLADNLKITHANRINRNAEEERTKHNNSARKQQLTDSAIETADQTGNEALIHSLTTQDRIVYSQLKVRFYEPEKSGFEKKLFVEEIKPYQPNIFLKSWEAIKNGAALFQGIFLFMLETWSIWALGLIGFYAWKHYFRKKQAA